MFDIYVIGCGGVGGFLLQLLPQCLASLWLELIGGTLADGILTAAGTEPVCSLARSLALIDGDRFDPHNSVRQAAGTGDKLAVLLRMLEESMVRKLWLSAMELRGYACYVTPGNISKIIPHALPDIGEEYRQRDYFSLVAHEVLSNVRGKQTPFRRADGLQCKQYESIPVVFFCADNHKSRYEVARYMETFHECIFINGGNSFTSGNVTLYQRLENRALDPEIYKIYPEIATSTSKRPDELPCTELSAKHDQLAIVNNMIATVMVNLFRKLVLGTLTMPGSKGRMNEVVVDIEACTMLPLTHNT